MTRNRDRDTERDDLGKITVSLCRTPHLVLSCKRMREIPTKLSHPQEMSITQLSTRAKFRLGRGGIVMLYELATERRRASNNPLECLSSIRT